MKYEIKRDDHDIDSYIVRANDDYYIGAFIACIHADLLSDELKDIIDRDGSATVEFKLSFGEKK